MLRLSGLERWQLPARLDFITEGVEGVVLEDGEPQEDDPADPGAFLAAQLEHLGLDSERGPDWTTRALSRSNNSA
jgi:hypothetical protein